MAELNNVYKLEHTLNTLIFSDNKCSVHFDYSKNKDGTKYKLKIYTFNPTHNTFFLFYKTSTNIVQESSMIQKDNHYKTILLNSAIDYLKQNTVPKTQLNYTIIWSHNEINKKNVSYFVGATIKDIVDKFFVGKNHHDYVIYEIKLNPVS